MPNNISVTGTTANQLPAFIKGVTLSHGGYTIGAGSALSPGSYTLQANTQDLAVSVDVSLKQFVQPSISALRIKEARAELVDSLYVLVVATTNKTVAQGIQVDPNQLKQYLENASYTSGNGSIQAKRLPLSQAAGLMPEGDFSDASMSRFSNMIGLDIPLSTAFTFPGQANPDYLCIFAITFIDSNADADINIISQNDVALGSPATELIISAGTLHIQTTLFYTASTPGDSGSLWIGPVHQDRNNHWRTGPTAAPENSGQYNGALLTTKTVYNSKIADHRGVSKLERM